MSRKSKDNKFKKFIMNPWIIAIGSGVILLLLGIFFSSNGQNIDNSFNDNSVRAILEIQGNNYGDIIWKSNISMKNIPSDCSGYYRDGFQEMIFHGNDILSKPYPYPGLRNVLIKLPNNQEVFLKELLHNHSYTAGICNQDLSDCCIYNSYRWNKNDYVCVLKEKQVWKPNISTQDIVTWDPFNEGLTDADCKIKYPEIKYIE